MKHCKRILATLLSMAMLFTMAATPVYAAPESTGDSIYKDVSSSEGYYPGLVIQNKLGCCKEVLHCVKNAFVRP